MEEETALPLRALTVTAVLAVLSLGQMAMPADAAFIGTNGNIAFVSARNGFPADNDLYTMTSAGASQTRITSLNQDELYPSWSPDGTKIVFQRDPGLHPAIWVVNSDGSGQQQLTNNASDDRRPGWSPTGAKIVFASNRDGSGGRSDLFVMNANGSGQVNITNTPSIDEDYPSWSPDGNKIAFSRDGDIYTVKPDGTALTPLTQTARTEIEPDWSPYANQIAFRTTANVDDEIWKMNANGSGQTDLTNNGSVVDEHPSWSPAGDKIAFARGAFGSAEVYTMNPDGTGQTAITSNTVMDGQPAWQPVPFPAYPRPKGASPFYASLVLANRPCTAPNSNHGPPLAHPSCNPPRQVSRQLTVGSPDVNGNAASFVGFYRMVVIPGITSTTADEADVSIQIDLKDVRRKSDLADYTGGLRARSYLRLTDKDNLDGAGTPGVGTRADTPFVVNLGCAPTADTSIGSTCSIDTTADALYPGAIVENMRAVWQLDQIQVFDGGADGNPRTVADNYMFAVQGVFVP